MPAMRSIPALTLLSILAAVASASPVQAPPPSASELTAEQQTLLAGIYFPTSMAFDSAGNFYISEGNSARVRKVTSAGAVTFVAGNGIPGFSGDNGPATSAQLRNPFDIAVDASGNLYIADSGNSRIRKVSADGVISTVAGSGTPGFSGDGGPATGAQLNNPRGIVFDKAGNLYIADTGSNRIRKVTPAGVISTIAGTGIFAAGKQEDGGLAIESNLRTPYGIVVDATGNVYFAETGAGRVRKVAVDGRITTVAGNGTRGFTGDGGLATDAQLTTPLGLSLDEAGNLYISDVVGVRIRQVTTDGRITTIAGNGTHGSRGDSGPATDAQLDEPIRAVVGPSNTLFIVDPGAQRIRAVSQGRIGAVTGTGRIAIPVNQNVLKNLPATIVAPNTLPERVGGLVSAPTCNPTPEPNYSDEARMAGVSGSTTLDAMISKDGNVSVMGVPHPLGFGLDAQAIAITRLWKCKPSTRDGTPVNVQLNIVINFHLY
jgi:TonB family protein